jgi:AcrR family transcriptional regulator
MPSTDPLPSDVLVVPDLSALRFADAVQVSAGADGLAKRERTRLSILAAAARELDEHPPNALTVAAVARRAGVAHGTVYLHFADGSALVAAVAGAFARFVRGHLSGERAGAPGSDERVRATTRRYAMLFRENAGLMRCMMQVGAEDRGFRESLHALNRDWNGRVARAIGRRRQAAGLPTEEAETLYTAYALDGMIDEFLTQIYIRRDPALAALAEDPDRIADLLGRLWARAAVGAP